MKIEFNTWGWIVIAFEEDNCIRHMRFDTKAGAKAFLKQHPDAWLSS